MIGEKVVVSYGVHNTHWAKYRRGVIVSLSDASGHIPSMAVIRCERRGKERKHRTIQLALSGFHLQSQPMVMERLSNYGLLHGHDDA